MKEIIDKLLKFREERNWEEFHTPKNLACSISIEAGELLELFQWDSKCSNRWQIKHEIADIIIYCIYLADHYSIDIEDAIKDKITINEKKYPISKSKGKATKYDKLV